MRTISYRICVSGMLYKNFSPKDKKTQKQKTNLKKTKPLQLTTWVPHFSKFAQNKINGY